MPTYLNENTPRHATSQIMLTKSPTHPGVHITLQKSLIDTYIRFPDIFHRYLCSTKISNDNIHLPNKSHNSMILNHVTKKYGDLLFHLTMYPHAVNLI